MKCYQGPKRKIFKSILNLRLYPFWWRSSTVNIPDILRYISMFCLISPTTFSINQRTEVRLLTLTNVYFLKKLSSVTPSRSYMEYNNILIYNMVVRF